MTKLENLRLLKSIAKKQGGKCLSSSYKNSKTPMKWMCKHGHTWKVKADHVKAGSWCRKCVGTAKLTIKEMKIVAKARGGACLSKKYIDSQTKLHWKCKKGHEFFMAPNKVKMGQWCRICSIRRSADLQRDSITSMRSLAKTRGGKCLSLEYSNRHSKLIWQCQKGHIWEAAPAGIVQGHWCPECGGRKKLTFQKLAELAASKGGFCLTKTYKNAHTPVDWKCSEGHIWSAPQSDIKAGRWCPHCAGSIGERLARAFFESFFKRPFKRSRPDWLKTSNGNRLELDGLNEDLKLAFEHHGEYHYSLTGFYSKNRKQLTSRKNYDRQKRLLTERRGILLIEVPEIPSRLPLEDLESHIKRCLEKNSRDVPKTKVNLENVLAKAYSATKITVFKEIAISRGGTCLSEKYLHSYSPLKFKCSQGHVWEAKPNNITQGSWCPKCARLNGGSYHKLNIETMHTLASERNGQCLSDVYINVNTKLKWKCQFGHTWSAKLR